MKKRINPEWEKAPYGIYFQPWQKLVWKNGKPEVVNIPKPFKGIKLGPPFKRYTGKP